LQEARDVHVQRAGVLARRQRQVLADAGMTPLRPDVILEFVAEMAQRREDRVGGGLAEPAQRGVADHLAQFVQFGQVLLAAFALVMRVSVRSALSRPTRQGVHLPQDSERVNSMK